MRCEPGASPRPALGQHFGGTAAASPQPDAAFGFGADSLPHTVREQGIRRPVTAGVGLHDLAGGFGKRREVIDLRHAVSDQLLALLIGQTRAAVDRKRNADRFADPVEPS